MLHHYIVNGKEELLRHVAKEMKLVSVEIERKEMQMRKSRPSGR